VQQHADLTFAESTDKITAAQMLADTHYPRLRQVATKRRISERDDENRDGDAVLYRIAGGAVKAIAVLSDQKLPQLPNVATAVSAGYGDINIRSWNALFLPKGVPDEARARLARLSASLKAPRRAWASACWGRSGTPVIAGKTLKSDNHPHQPMFDQSTNEGAAPSRAR